MANEKRGFRILSLEGVLAAFGLYSLVSGLMRGEATAIFWGIMILCGMVALHFVRRKDWAKHWEEVGEGRK